MAINKIESAGLGSGAVVQVVNAQLNTFFQTAAAIPLDDTIPQNTEGAEILTCSITPKFATSKLLITVEIQTTNSSAATLNCIALFQDSAANALNAAWGLVGSANNPASPLTINHYMLAGTTSSTTFKIRGGTLAGTGQIFQVNGGSGARYLGGALVSSITITEVAA